MRMMCIRGRQHPAHTGLVSGQVYEVSIAKPCCVTAAHAEGSIFLKRVKMICNRCGAVMHRVVYVPWSPDRFVPWSDPKIEEAEVQRLYRPSRRKEKV